MPLAVVGSSVIRSLDSPRASAPRGVPAVARWVLPNLCAAVFAVTLLQVLVVSGGAHALFRDSDTGWHIRTGDIILKQRVIPTTDPFSFTRAGRAWFAWEWLADLAFGVAHRAAGLPGVALLGAFTIALAVAGSAALALRLGANFFAAAASAVLLLGVSSLHWLARPHLFSWLLGLAFVAIAELHIAELQRPGKRMLWLLPLLGVLWANVHGSFLLGPAILAAYALGRRQIDYFLVTLLTLLGTFINPFGWRLH